MMNFLDQLDPELRVALEAFPTEKAVDLNDITAARAKMKKLFSTMQETVSPIEGVTSQDESVPGPQGGPDVPVRIYQPYGRPSLLPALLWIHGGGYVMGDIEQDDRLMKQLVKRIGCVAVSVGYRLPPEHRFPAPVEDCYAGLQWLFTHADDLGVDASRAAVLGSSHARPPRSTTSPAVA